MIRQFFHATRSLLFSKTMKMVLAVGGVSMLVAGNLGFGCTSSSGGGGDPGVISVPLEYRPTDNDRAPLVSIPNRNAVRILVTVNDKRDESERASIGENREDRNPISVRTSGSHTVADFVTRAARDELRSAGFSTTDDMAQATHTLDIDVMTFNVIEDSTYNAQVQLVAKLVDPTGKELWHSDGSGTNKTFGKSKSAENYNQVLSNAAKAAIDRVLSDPELKRSFGGEPK